MAEVISEKLLLQAKEICQQRNVRLTPQRFEVLRLLTEQKNAISAYDLLDLLKETEPQAKPPTIYRALEFLLEQGFIHRVESSNSYVVCNHFGQSPHTSAMLLCDRCGVVDEKHADGVKAILKTLAQQAGFILQHSVIEIHGLCPQCADALTVEQGR